MKRPRLLDLFCGGGGCSVGYARAGFEVVGVDINPQPHYPFEFHQADAMTFPLDGFDAIHASPPCQAYSQINTVFKNKNKHREYPKLVPAVRERLEATGVPYVIENVEGAPLLPDRSIKLCGSMFGLRVRRHRLFESNIFLLCVPCNHTNDRTIAVYGDHPQSPGDKTYRINRARTLAEGQHAMGIEWMPWKPLTQAIPPQYTEFIGEQLLRAMEIAA